MSSKKKSASSGGANGTRNQAQTHRQQKRSRRGGRRAPTLSGTPNTPIPPATPKTQNMTNSVNTPAPSALTKTQEPRVAVSLPPASSTARATPPQQNRQKKTSAKATASPAIMTPHIAKITEIAETSEISQKARKTKVAAKTQATKPERTAEDVSTQTTSERRYPTLARMAAIAPRTTPAPAAPSTTPDDVSNDADTESDLPATREMADDAPPLSMNANIALLDALPTSEEAPLTDEAAMAITAIPPTPTTIPKAAEEAMTPPARRVPVRTRNLRDLPRSSSDSRSGETAPTRVPFVAPRAALTETDPLLREYPLTRPQPLPATNLVVPVAVVEAGVAAAAAISTAALLLAGSTGAFWTLALTVIAGLGGWLAYALAHDAARERSAGAVLLASQLGMLAWGMALLGPRASLLALLPIMLLLALRTTSRMIAALGVVVALAMYGLFVVLSLNEVVRPGLQLNSALAAVLDGVFVVAGMLLLLRAVLDIHFSRSKAELLARARLHELRQVRARAAELRQQSDEDALRIHDALMTALYGRGDTPPALKGPSSQVNDALELLSERMTVLQRDREERLRLEGALRRLTRAVERAWLGLPWKWPEPSGTSLDELVALLRTPDPRQAQASITQDTPASLVPIPSLDPSLTPAPWEAPALHPRVREHLSDPSWSFGQQPNNGARLNGPASRISPLPWLEWDAWRNWDDRFSS